MPDDPTTSKMLSEEERKLAIARMDVDAVMKSQGRKEKTTWTLVGHSFNVVVSVPGYFRLDGERRANCCGRRLLRVLSCS